MRIYVVRHGQTTGDLEDRYGGDYDDHLSDEGLLQAEKLADKLKDKSIQIIYHSPRKRAKETAQILSERIGVPMQEVPDLRERNAYGVLSGLVKSEAKALFPEEVEKLTKDKIHHDISNSEKYEIFKKRILDALSQLINIRKYERIVIVTHGGPISCITRELLKMGEIKTMDDCCIMVLRTIKDSVRLAIKEGITMED
jgi:broad specificity phosphatase PhoE